jgi:hypothetical protein
MQGDETPTDRPCAAAEPPRKTPRERPEPVVPSPWPPLRYDVESLQHWLDLSA